MYENGLDDSRYVAQGNRPEAVRWLLAAAEQACSGRRSNSQKSTPPSPRYRKTR
jgi:hypothetical protein